MVHCDASSSVLFKFTLCVPDVDDGTNSKLALKPRSETDPSLVNWRSKAEADEMIGVGREVPHIRPSKVLSAVGPS